MRSGEKTLLGPGRGPGRSSRPSGEPRLCARALHGRLALWLSEATAASYAAALDAWSRLAPAGLDRTLLPGDHYSLLRRPEVERLAGELTAQLVRNDDDG